MTLVVSEEYGQRRRNAGLLAGLFFLLLIPFSSADALDTSYDADVVRIENIAAENPDSIRGEADKLRTTLRQRIETEQGFADTAASQARQYRDLAASARESAAENRRRAESYEADARDPLLDDAYKASLRRSAQSARDDAAADEERARERDANAARRRVDAQGHLNKVAAYEALISRIEAAFAATEKPEAAETEQPASEAETAETSATPERQEITDLRVEEVLGVWRPTEGDEFPFVIVQQDPESKAYPHRLEAHTDKRVWKGNFTSFPRGDPGRSQPARMVFTYTPQPREMNPDIPDWVAAAIDGHLTWRLELDEAGTRLEPRLRVRWYRGEVRWTEGEERRAWVEGDGVPLVFELEPETIIQVAQLSAPMLWLEPEGSRSQVPEPMTAIFKHQPFKVKVRLPPALAKEAGDKISVAIKGLTNEDETTLELHASAVSGFALHRAVDYTTERGITIAEPMSEPDRNPQLGSIGWIEQAYARSDEEGRRIDLDVDDKELVEFRYGDTYQQIAVYDNWISRGLDQHWDTAQALRAAFAKTVGDNTAPPAKREAATLGLRLVNNYLALRERDDLLDLHKFYLGELYLTHGVDGTPLTCFGLECGELPMGKPLAMLSRETMGRMMQVARRGDEDPAYFTTMVEGFVEAITGDQTQPVAVRVRDAVHWTGEGERALVALTLASASSEVRHTFQNNVGEVAYAIPRAMAEDVSIILYGVNLKNKPVAAWDREVTLARTVAQLLLNAVQPQIMKGVSRLRADMRRPLGRASLARSTIRLRSMRTGAATQTQGIGPALSEDMPSTVREGQMRQATLRLEPDPPEGPHAIRCARPAIRLEEGIDLDPDLLAAEQTARALYGSDVQVVQTGLRPPQQGGTCMAVSADFVIHKRTGADLGEAGILSEVAQSAKDVYHSAAKRASFRDKIINMEYARIAGKSPTAIAQQIFDDGVPARLLRHVLREQGADVAQTAPEFNSRLNLRHVKMALDRDYDVLLAIDLSENVGEANAFHAIIVTGFEKEGGHITRVRFFEPNIGGELSLPMPQFERLIARLDANGNELDWGNMMAIKWDGRDWSATASSVRPLRQGK